MKIKWKQECNPVECVPAALVPFFTGGVSVCLWVPGWDVSASGSLSGVCLSLGPWRVSAIGSRGCICLWVWGGLPSHPFTTHFHHTPFTTHLPSPHPPFTPPFATPPYGQTNTCENITLPVLGQ